MDILGHFSVLGLGYILSLQLLPAFLHVSFGDISLIFTGYIPRRDHAVDTYF